MKKQIVGYFILLLVSNSTIAQEQEEALVYDLVELVNKLREKKGVSPLEQDEILDAAAFDQAEYILEAKRIVHEQDNEKKETVQKRVLSYDGLHADLGENAAMIDLYSKAPIEPNGERVELETEELLLQAAVSSWLEDEISRENLLDPEFYNMGGAIIIQDETKYIIVAVFGSSPYENRTNKKAEIKFHGIKPFKKEACRELFDDHPTLPQLFSDAVVVENNEAFFQYHNLALLEHILDGAGDGIAADVIQRDQFNCDGGNQLFPTEINDGYLMYPIRKAKLTSLNLLDSIKEVKVSLGRLPKFYDPEQSEINLVIQKSGHYCMTVPYNRLKTENKKWFNMPFMVAGDTDSSVFTWRDSILFDYSGLSDWQTQLKNDLKTLNQFDYELNAVQVTQQIAPTETDATQINASSFEFLGEGVAIEVENFIAWDSLQRRIKNTYYQLDLAELDTTGKIEFLRESVAEDKDMRDYLNGLNRVFIQLSGLAKIRGDVETQEIMNAYRLFLNANEIEPALYLQALLLDKVLTNELKASQIPLADPSQKENTLAVINNQIVLETIMGAKSYGGNPIYLAFFELYLINKAEVEVSFNYHVALLHHWANYPADIRNFDSWLKDFNRIPSEKISSTLYAKAMFNYYLLAIDYYYEKNDFNSRKKAIVELIKWQTKADLTDIELLDLASYLCFQDQFASAIELLLAEVNKESVNKEILLYFLQIAQYDKEQVPNEKLVAYFKMAKEQYPKEFCNLFSKEKMGVQALKNYKIKQLYCKTCQ